MDNIDSTMDLARRDPLEFAGRLLRVLLKKCAEIEVKNRLIEKNKKMNARRFDAVMLAVKELNKRAKDIEAQQYAVDAEKNIVEMERCDLMRARRELAKDCDFGMQEAPLPMLTIGDGQKPPAESAVYFVWKDGEIVYVGESGCVSQRVKTGHEKSFKGEGLSWLLVPFEELLAAEMFYIWKYRPIRNDELVKRRSTNPFSQIYKNQPDKPSSRIIIR